MDSGTASKEKRGPGRRPRTAWGPDDYRALARKLENVDPDRYDRHEMSAHELIRRLKPRMMAAILDGRTDLYGVHSLLREQGVNVSIPTLRRYLSAGPVAEPRQPGQLKRKQFDQHRYDVQVRDVCRALPQSDVPPKVWARYEVLKAKGLA